MLTDIILGKGLILTCSWLCLAMYSHGRERGTRRGRDEKGNRQKRKRRGGRERRKNRRDIYTHKGQGETVL